VKFAQLVFEHTSDDYGTSSIRFGQQ
jgi:hypothetical protein